MSAAQSKYPPDYRAEYIRRMKIIIECERSPELRAALKVHYANGAQGCIDWISDWGITFDPRRKGTKIVPFILFPKQVEFVHYVIGCMHDKESGLVEKSRDVGATWLCCMISIWLWLFHPGSIIGWGSRDEDTVDKNGDPASIFEKMRMQLDNTPAWMLPYGFDRRKNCKFMNIVNHENKSAITGDAGDNIGRGGRSMVYFKDESAWYEHPEQIEAALGDNTDVQIDISSVNGTANVFYRRRQAGDVWSPTVKPTPGKVRVFIFDWRDHPGKTQAWYDQRRAKYESEGLMHILAQEVDRDYAGAVLGTIIPAQWIRSSIDAHIKLNIDIRGERIAALDVADGGEDKNAYTFRHGILLKRAQDWGGIDTGLTANKAIDMMAEDGCLELNYDCIGVGSGVKAETNRLQREGKLPKGMTIKPWDAGATPENAEYHMIAEDQESPKIKDIFLNRKIQGWWMLRLRFEKTHKMITQGVIYPHDELISLDSKMENLHRVVTELSQPVFVKDGNGIMKVDKKPAGSVSPNLADGVMMDYHPVREWMHGVGWLEFMGQQVTKETAERLVANAPIPSETTAHGGAIIHRDPQAINYDKLMEQARANLDN